MKRRHTIYIEQNSFALVTRHCERTHLITLSNQKALDKVVDYILRMDWLDDLVSADDILVYDEDLD